MSNKHILFLCHYFTPHVGGVEKHVEKISEILLKKGYSVVLISWQHNRTIPLHEKTNGIQIFRIPYDFHEKKIQTWIWMLKHIQLFQHAQIIHVHDVFWWILPLCPFFFFKTFITFHGYEGSESPRFRQRFQHQVANFLTRGSMGIGGFHKKWYGVQTTATSFGAIDRKVKGNPPPSRLVGLRRTKKGAVYIGRLSEDVGIMTYLDLIKKLKEKGENLSLDVFGDGMLRRKAEQFVKKYQLPVVFKGFVPNVCELLPSYSYAFVSRHLAILEALSVGIPVLAEYNNEIKKDYLLLSPFRYWISVGQRAEELFASFSKDLHVSSTAQKWARAQTWEKLSDQYEELWKK